MESEFFTDYYISPVGLLKVKADDSKLLAVGYASVAGKSNPNAITDLVKKQLKLYFRRRLKEFELPLAMNGTNFQNQVWIEVCKVKYGTTASYKNIAEALGNVKAVRAVGMANGKNPLLIIIPCHRIIGADNGLTGYAGGFRRKEYLLRHEGALAVKQVPLFEENLP